MSDCPEVEAKVQETAKKIGANPDALRRTIKRLAAEVMQKQAEEARGKK